MNSTGDYDVGCDEAVVLNFGVMADVIAGPESYVVSDFYEWLNRIILKDKAIFADRLASEHGGVAAAISCEGVAFGPSFGYFGGAQLVELVVADGDKKVVA